MGMNYKSVRVRRFGGEILPRLVVHSERESAYKTYFYELQKLDDPKVVWATCGYRPQDVLDKMADETYGIFGRRSIGAMAVFPHIIARLWWEVSDDRETNPRRQFYTVSPQGKSFPILDLDPKILGCLQESLFYGNEAGCWAYASCVASYLLEEGVTTPLDMMEGIEVMESSKLQEFWDSRQERELIFKDACREGLLRL